jgi:hypothetical protein
MVARPHLLNAVQCREARATFRLDSRTLGRTAAVRSVYYSRAFQRPQRFFEAIERIVKNRQKPPSERTRKA